MTDKLFQLTTEARNQQTQNLDQLPTEQILKIMNDEDKKVAFAVEEALPQVAKAVELVANALQNGGRLFYFGAGTSGRLGILDAVECPPTFGTAPELVQGVIAGGSSALLEAIEGAEDLPELGRQDVHKYGVSGKDVVLGIAASGRTPYVIGALAEAKERGAKTISLSCNPQAKVSEGVDVAIHVVVGPEVVTGSTRLKAATAQKMVLNMISTVSMIRLGKVYGNLMVNVQATNQKLRERVKRIVMEATGISYAEAERLAEQAGGDARVAILMQKTGLPRAQAVELLTRHGGRIRDAIESENKNR
ncbi:N-acetylmuramic acid 6-phosphate etherase [Brevibacillus marinus]|uniref:N-acetylmuramic acid 6-phosphate etherase n=1 Tax=Brevibacillus marinus TaxID=2496837 RepID=UPI000F83993D|nr:N-acetylmuramic acid 6-phosphate etherase [Brevibacillus marinus]